MKNKITVGPIKRRTTTPLVTVVRAQVNKMKLGEFFEISGVDSETVSCLRSNLSYHAKKDGFRIKTEYRDNTLIIDRVRK